MVAMNQGNATMGFSKRLRQRREELQLTQAELADEVGVTHQHISRIETEQVAPSLDLLVRLAARLGTSNDWLLTGTERPLLTAEEAVRADRALSAGAKRHLVGLVVELRRG